MVSARAVQWWVLLASGLAFAAPSPDSDADSNVPAHQKHPVDPKPPPAKGKMIQLTLAGGKTAAAYVSRPKGTPRGAILLVHEWWGLNGWVKADADKQAAQGYLALAVDLYDGKVAATKEEAGELMKALDNAHSTAVETAGIDWLAKNAPGKKIATIGWCMGGGESLNASLANADKVSATVMYYGLPVTDVDRLKKLKGPILGIWAKKDGWITPERVAGFDTALRDAGIKHEFRSYDADHAFANPSGGSYNPDAAKDANEATRRWLAGVLKS